MDGLTVKDDKILGWRSDQKTSLTDLEIFAVGSKFWRYFNFWKLSNFSSFVKFIMSATHIIEDGENFENSFLRIIFEAIQFYKCQLECKFLKIRNLTCIETIGDLITKLGLGSLQNSGVDKGVWGIKPPITKTKTFVTSWKGTISIKKILVIPDPNSRPHTAHIMVTLNLNLWNNFTCSEKWIFKIPKISFFTFTLTDPRPKKA